VRVHVCTLVSVESQYGPIMGFLVYSVELWGLVKGENFFPI
jgi:hypothetical protein